MVMRRLGVRAARSVISHSGFEPVLPTLPQNSGWIHSSGYEQRRPRREEASHSRLKGGGLTFELYEGHVI